MSILDTRAFSPAADIAYVNAALAITFLNTSSRATSAKTKSKTENNIFLMNFMGSSPFLYA
jgi:hypothetical protein